jgi:hypothetical protein
VATSRVVHHGQPPENHLSLHLYTLRKTTQLRSIYAAMDNKDNANPLILNASDLPSRRGADMVRPRADGGTGLFDGLLNGQSPYSLDPFAENLSSSSDDDSSSEVEEIDAQEVYGTSHPFPR